MAEKRQGSDTATLRRALELCRDALDRLLGDTDLDGDDSLEMCAMQAAALALSNGSESSHPPPGVTALVRAAVRVVALDNAAALDRRAVEALRAAITDVEPGAFEWPETEGGE